MNQKGFVPILIVILVAATLLGGYFIYQKQTQPTTSSQPATQPSPTPNPTSNWKTYTNPLGFFSLKIPQGWVVDPNSKNPIIFYKPSLKSSEPSDFDPELDKGELLINIYIDTVPITSLEAYVRADKEESIELHGESVEKSWIEKAVLVDKQTAIMTDTFMPGFVVYVQDPSKITTISIAFLGDFDNYKDLANQILSTFKFTQ